MIAQGALAGAAALFALAAPAVAQEVAPGGPQPCLADGDKIEGEFRWVDTRHIGTHRPLHVPFLVMAAPRCVHDEFGRAQGRWVQLSLERKADIAKLKPGDILVIRAAYKAPEAPEHIGDIIASEALVLEQHAP